jgi:hypothetical protein
MIADVTRYGAVGDGIRDCTAAFEKAVEACKKAGGGTVTVPAGDYVSGTIRLCSRVYLELQPGSRILGSRKWADYTGTKRGCAWKNDIARLINPKIAADELVNPCRALVLCEDAEHVGIFGPGTLDGRRGTAYPGDPEAGNPFLVVFSHCRDVRLQDVQMTDPGSFTNYLLGCEDVNIRGLHIDSARTPCGDGIDFDGGRNVVISGCIINAGDDGIGLKTLSPDEPCERFEISDCIIRSKYWGCVRLGPESCGDMRYVSVRNCTFYDSNDGIKLQNCEEYTFEHLSFTGLTMDRVVRPFFITQSHYAFSLHSHGVRPPLGRMRHILFSDINAKVDAYRTEVEGAQPGCVAYALPGSTIEGLTVRNVRLEIPGGGTPEQAARADQPDMLDYVQQYPESCVAIGVPPAAALYLRGLYRSELGGISVSPDQPDARSAIVAERCDGLRIGPVFAPDCGADLRAHDCTDLSFPDGSLRVLDLTPEGKDAYRKAREEALDTDRRMEGISSLYDRIRGQTPYAVLDTENPGTGDFRKGDILILPFTPVPVRVTLDGEEVGTLDYPAPYRTLTKYALVLPRDGSCLQAFSGRSGQALLYRSGTGD